MHNAEWNLNGTTSDRRCARAELQAGANGSAQCERFAACAIDAEGRLTQRLLLETGQRKGVLTPGDIELGHEELQGVNTQRLEDIHEIGPDVASNQRCGNMV